ncbi:HD domain-containing phosphohydrolase [Deinococcus aquaedulcis]|uniref:HD domain-containing phosphohydrolase n=1 Tax=Deinococcus aquaedulcis TaxID=2840455 RepID=UPI001C83CB34|nr:HD domain-containing phosphohydrolase [Deinococcus aquaedulcis]
METLLDTDPAAALELLKRGDRPPEVEAGRWAFWQGRALYATGDLPGAADCLRRATAFFENRPPHRAAAEAWLLLGRIFLATSQFDDAQGALDQTRALATRLPALDLEATALNQLAAVSHHRGESGQALQHLHTALDINTRLGDVTGQVQCLTNIAAQQSQLGQYKEALEQLNRAYQLAKSLPGPSALETPILSNLAQVHSMCGDHQLAYEVMRAAYHSLQEVNTPQQRALVTLNLGVFALEVGALDEAGTHLQQALTESRTIGFPLGELSALDSLGTLHERTGELAQAQVFFTGSLQLALQVGSAQGEVEARLNLGRLQLRAGRLDAAEADLRQAEKLAIQAGFPKQQIEAAEALMALYEERGDLQRALACAHTLRQLERQRFDTDRERQTRQLAIQFEVERAQQDARLYQLRTAMAQEAQEAAEQQVRERTAELARAQHEVVTRLAVAAEYRDDTTGEHTRRVGRAAARIARALGWPQAQASMLGVAARLHDVGKIGIPDRILLKRSRLTPEEFAQMQQHPLIGGRILSGGRSALLQMAEEIARSHHERWDGSGYPLGLRGEAIPLTGRIVAVADVFDALTQARPYKLAWTVEQSLEELQAQAGRQFDPAVVEAALRVLPLQGADELLGSEHDPLLAEEEAPHVLQVFEHLLAERLAGTQTPDEPGSEQEGPASE